ncbi:DUF4845 domain-containing protein [Sulfurivermis fontis]|uniref:DUF4845 domain-containing protein n=1 Tax=Sulfurivermis fontis TaxID=1972068 RepID=UPI0015591DFB|nr:DUF4845 domain-containing protein [Sulfurivermis fontis]
MKQRQAGLTLVSWMVIFVIAGILAMGFLKLFPVYMEHLGVTSSLESLSTNPSLRGSSPAEIRDALMKRMEVNDVNRVKRDDITIERDGAVYKVTVAYEVVVPFVHNISFLVSFEDVAEVAAR